MTVLKIIVTYIQIRNSFENWLNIGIKKDITIWGYFLKSSFTMVKIISEIKVVYHRLLFIRLKSLYSLD